MRNDEIETLEKVLALIENNFSDTESTLISQYKLLCEKFRSKNDKEKQSYSDKQQYHRDYTKSWREEHPEQVKKYRDEERVRRQEKKRNEER